MIVNYKVLAINTFHLIQEINAEQRSLFVVLTKRSTASRDNNGQGMIWETLITQSSPKFEESVSLANSKIYGGWVNNDVLA